MKMHAIKAGCNGPACSGAESFDSGLDFPACGGTYLSASHHVRHIRWCDRPGIYRNRLAARMRQLREDLATVPVHGGGDRRKRADGFIGIDPGLIVVVLAAAVDKHVTGDDPSPPPPPRLPHHPTNPPPSH